ncbi:MAG: nuclear transport factor 2 family protein [Anaerolineales bacterium]|nr:nuclear transport factor 2 family protein [Anaerolineales bacterium]
MALEGKGFFIWRILNCEGGDANAIANKAEAARLTHVLIKIADTRYPFGYDRNNNDLVPPVSQALKNRGMQVWGWHYVKGSDPAGEARVAIARTRELQLDGYVIDAEHEYKWRGKDAAARLFMTELRQALPNHPIALSSYRFPTYHRELPWAAFLEKCDFNMPQVYWEQAHNPGAQLERSVGEFADTRLVGHARPVIPTGSAYGAGGWVATAEDQRRFYQKALELSLSAANTYSWDWSTSPGHHDLWDAVAGFQWPLAEAAPTVPAPAPMPPGVPNDPLQHYVDALNNRDIDLLVSLYHENAGHVNAQRMILGIQAIREWYRKMLDELLPSGNFAIDHVRGKGASWTFNWTFHSPAGQMAGGKDTLGLREGRIQYHYSSFAGSHA